MSRESKVLIGVGALVVVGLILAVIGQTSIGVVAVLAGLVLGVVALRVTKTSEANDPFAEVRSEADQHNTGTLTPSDPLAPWSPDGGLNAWTPPADLAPPPAPTYEPPTYEPPAPTYEPPAPTYEPQAFQAPPAEPAPEPTPAWDQGWDSTVSWAPESDPVAEPFVPTPAPPPAPTETNPLDDLVGLDALDPIAEVERIENRSTSYEPDTFQPFEPSTFDEFGRGSHVVINEDVSGADDIMAASQATELNLADGEQTELQKLLAKVQIRLSAYE